MLISTFTLAMNGFISKILTDYFPTEIMVFLRISLPAVVMLSLAAMIDWRMPTKAAWKTFATRGVFIVCCQACFLVALTKLTLIEAVVLFSTGPLFIPLIERVIFKTRIHWVVLPTFILMFAGMAIQNIQADGFVWRPALLIGLGAGVFNACSQVTLFRASQIKLPVLVINGWCFALASLILLPVVMGLMDGDKAMTTLHSLSNTEHYIPIFIIFLGISTTLTQFFRSKAYRLANSNSEVAPLIYTNLVFALMFQVIFFDTHMTLHQIFGTALIVVATLINTFGRGWLQSWQARKTVAVPH